MTDRLTSFVGDINTRLKRLEETIGSVTDTVLRFVSIKEEMALSDTVYIYKCDVNDSFLLGVGRVGIDGIGDHRSAEVLIWSGG